MSRGSGPASRGAGARGPQRPPLASRRQTFTAPRAVGGGGGEREGCGPGMKGFGGACHGRGHPLRLPPRRGPGQRGEGRRWQRGAPLSSCPHPRPPGRQLPRGQASLRTLLPGALPISLLSQQTTPVTVTQINSNPLDLSGKRAALTCHKSPGRRERRPAPTPSSPRPAAHLPRSPVSR